MLDAIKEWPSAIREKTGTGGDIAAGIAPIAVVALSVYYVYNKINESLQWAADQREYRQSSTTTHRIINAVLLFTGVFIFALKALETVSAATLAWTGFSIGGVIFGAMLMNHVMYQRYLTHDGRKL